MSEALIDPTATGAQEPFVLFFAGDEAKKASRLARWRSLPKEIAGQPCTYLWKDVISVGDYKHPHDKWELHVTPDQLTQWAGTGNQMIAAGIPIPINTDHSDAAKQCVGYVKGFKVKGQRLYTLCQLIGADAPLLAARNMVSVGIETRFIDSQEKNWGQVIYHIALTPIPLIPNQSPFLKAASLHKKIFLFSAEGKEQPTGEQTHMHTLKCSQETLDQLHKLVPGLSDSHDDDKIARIAQHIHSLNADMDSEGMPEMSASLAPEATIEIPTAEEVEATAAKLLTAATPVEHKELTLNPDLREAMVELVSTKLETAFEKGAIDRNTKSKLLSLFEPNDLAFIKASTSQKSLALSVVDVLLENKPIEVKEKSGLQVLSKEGTNTALTELNKHMADAIGVAPRK